MEIDRKVRNIKWMLDGVKKKEKKQIKIRLEMRKGQL